MVDGINITLSCSYAILDSEVDSVQGGPETWARYARDHIIMAILHGFDRAWDKELAAYHKRKAEELFGDKPPHELPFI